LGEWFGLSLLLSYQANDEGAAKCALGKDIFYAA